MLIDQGTKEFQAAEKAEAELSVRRRSALACETAFHALVELADVLIEQASHAPADTHDARVEALEDIGRQDLANTYHRAKDALHIGGYYAQRVGRLQADRLREISEVLERELRKLS